MVQHRPFNQRWIDEHQSFRLVRIQTLLVRLRELAKRRARAVQQAFPAEFLAPALMRLAIDTSIALAKVARNQRRQRKYAALAVVL